ncbi:MAG TPA: GNVR domain-containing protein [Terriglobia bacterium]|nr:GNVR domain-containing protein [Terriglobia bacterium]
MKGSNAKTEAGLSDLEAPISVGPENGDAPAGEPAAQQDFGERAAHHQTVASLRLLWESRRFLGRVAGAGLLLSALIALLIPSRYQSVARLMPPDNQSSSGLAMAAAALSGGAAGGMAGELLGLKSTSDLLVGILGSRTVEDKLIQNFDLRKEYGVRRMEDARKVLAAQTEISVDRKSQIITIGVTDKSPQKSAAMAQAYIEELNRRVAEVSTSSARRERMFLEGRLQAVNQDLEAAEKEFSQFASKNTAIDIKEQGKAMVDAAATLQGQYIAARSELEGLRQLYTDSNVRVRSVRARVGELENQLKIVGGKDDSSSLEKAAQGDSLYPSIRKLPLLGVPYADLFRKTKVQEAVFETLTQEYELAKVQEVKEIPTVKVLDPPNVPERKSSPHRALITLLGTALAFSCGVTWMFGRKMWEHTDSADPGKALAQEVFDTVKAAMPWASRNGYGLHTSSGKPGGHVVPTDTEKETGR